MRIEFEDLALEELYTNGTTTDGKYRKLPKDVIKQYAKVVNYIKSVRRLEVSSILNHFIMRKRKVI